MLKQRTNKAAPQTGEENKPIEKTQSQKTNKSNNKTEAVVQWTTNGDVAANPYTKQQSQGLTKEREQKDENESKKRSR